MNGPTNYADPIKRLLAAIIDGIILSIVSLIMATFTVIPRFVALVELADSASEEEIAIGVMESSGILLLFILGYYLLYFLYYSLQHSSEKQATLGKRAMKIYVADEHGYRLNFGKAALRVLGRFINGFTVGIGYLIILFTDKKQGLHDLIAKTLVLDGNQQQENSFGEEIL